MNSDKMHPTNNLCLDCFFFIHCFCHVMIPHLALAHLVLLSLYLVHLSFSCDDTDATLSHFMFVYLPIFTENLTFK